MIHMDSDFSNYDVILSPVLYMVKEGIAEKIENFVEQGGTFVTTYMSGIVDENDNVHLGGYPGPLRDVLGVWVEEIDALDPKITNDLVTKKNIFSKPKYQSNLLFDLMHSEGAEVVAEYGSDFYAGMPAITKNDFGNGEAWYVGTVLEQDMLNELISHILQSHEIKVFDSLPEGIEITPRETEDKKFIFVMNHLEEEQLINLPFENYIDLLTDTKMEAEISLKPYDVKILVEK